MIRRTLTILRALAALLVVCGLAFGVPVLLVALIGNPVPINWTWTQPLTNDAILGVVACGAWIFWAQMIGCLIIETVVEVRIATGRSGEWLSRVPGTFGGQQALARALVQAVLAVGLTSTALTPTGPWVDHADAATPDPPAQPQTSAPSTTHPAAVPAKPKPRHAATSTVDVRRGDSLWAIAEKHLGSGERWREIADLNRDRLMPDGNHFHDASTIQPGWTLLIPATTAKEPTTATVTVEPGDTLWEIADQEYGDGTTWPQIFTANADRIEEPNLIYPGQRLRIPGQQPPPDSEQPDTRRAPKHDEHPSEPIETSPPSPTAAPSPAPTVPEPSVTEQAPTVIGEDNAADRTVDTGALARALLGGGAFLAAGLVAALAARRRNQFRDRRSGRTIPRTPQPLVETERTVRTTGSAGGQAAAFLDAALRELAAKTRDTGAELPEIEAVRIDDERLDLHLSRASLHPPSPWLASADQMVWSLSREHRPVPGADATPYPTLVSVGIDDEGGVWLIDLESAGLVQVTGDPNVATEVARFIAAELTVNPRAIDVDVTLAGFGDELVALSPGRCRFAETHEISLLAKAALRAREASEVSGLEVLAGRLDGRGADSWWPTIHVASIGTDHEADARRDTSSFLDELSRVPGRSSVALVIAVREALVEAGLVLRVQPGGRLTTPWGDSKVNRLHADEASALANLVVHHDHAPDEPMPAAATPDASEALYDAAGAIAETRTEAREDIGGDSSLLPLANEVYVETAATTVEDLTVLAPRVPPQAARKVCEKESDLDADLAAWADPNSPRPKLKVLGPVEVHVPRDRPIDVGRRPAYYCELVAYLSAHPAGSTTDRIAAAFAVQNPTIHSRMATLRGWLGSDPRTGEPFLPESTLSPAGRVHGVPIYQLCGGLSDQDLFKRLRARGQARGAEGISDLVEALSLVTGRPYDQLRPSGYGWLAETPVDHYAVAAIADVAHVVATHALSTDQPERALWAAERAITAAPSDDKPRLDLASAMRAMGHSEDANAYLAAEVFNRSDDAHAPPDPSPRVSQVASRLKGAAGSAEIRDPEARG